MNIWDAYEDRMTSQGDTRREMALRRGARTLNLKVPDSLSYQFVTVHDRDHGYNILTEEMAAAAVERKVAIINSDNLDQKYIYSLPGEDIELGSLVYWMDNYWLVDERDANTTLYTRAKMIQCNFLLRWVSDDKEICEQWCIIEDGTKYLTGEYEDRNFVVTRGDSRISMELARNAKTKEFDRSRRFLIDDPDVTPSLAYTLSKPLKVGHYYNDYGVYKFVLQEVSTSQYDNQELQIADYYKYFPMESVQLGDTGSVTSDQRKVWL